MLLVVFLLIYLTGSCMFSQKGLKGLFSEMLFIIVAPIALFFPAKRTDSLGSFLFSKSEGLHILATVPDPSAFTAGS